VKSSGIIKQSGSWQAFRTLIAALPTTKAKGDAFESLCAAFLRTDPRYVAELHRVWLRSELPAAIASRLNLPRTDEGIDGIAQTRTGEFWSFQCKYLDDPQSTLTKNALDGFAHLSFTHCKGITKALVLHTSAAPIRKHRLLGISEVGLREFEQLDETGWSAIHRATGGRSHGGIPQKPRQPRPHQKAAVKAITKHLKTHDRGRVLMACGSGKSLVGFWVQQAMKAKQVVVAVPSLSLLNQTLREWATEWTALGQNVRFTAVCGDESAADIGDSFVGHAYELGIDTYTDTKRIADRLKALRKDHHVVFTTYQSSHRLAAASRRAGLTFDLGILDEAHRTVGERGDRFSTLLNAKAVSIRKRIAMTATERMLRGAHDRVLSMNDPKVYGEVAFSYTFKQAIADGVICDYKVVTLAVSERRIRELIRENRHLRLHARGNADRLRLAQDLAAGELLAKAQGEYGVRHAISFHRSISAASAFSDQWTAVDRLAKRRVRSVAFHVSSKVPTSRRVELLKEFRQAKSAVVTNARCLTEGVDVPNVDAVLFADPRRSTVDIVQAVGRALRKNQNKPGKIGYVLLPVLVEDGQSLEEFLDSSAFKEVGRVLATLSTHDERIAEEFRASERGNKRGSTREARIVFAGDVPVGVRFNAQEFAQQCRARVWERVARLNWRPYDQARAFARELRLSSYSDWRKYLKGEMPLLPILPKDIPNTPQNVYKSAGWSSFGDWFGTGKIGTSKRTFRPFRQARAFARRLKLRSRTSWDAYCRGNLKHLGTLPLDIPTNPHRTYAAQWRGLGDWLGTGTVATFRRQYRPFAEARAFVRNLGLRSRKDWKALCKSDLPGAGALPPDIPSNPNRTYADQGWSGMGDWLGTGRIADHLRIYRPLASAREFVRSLNLLSQREWFEYCAGTRQSLPRLPADIPANPANTYKSDGWLGFGDWLGNGNSPRRRNRRD
jgi:superfamily II DNA or RNA helicase